MPRHPILRWIALGAALLLTACSVPRLAYNNADSVLRLKLYGLFEPTQEQDVMMAEAIQRLHAWHRRDELPHYAEAFDTLAQRVESGLQETDIAHVRALMRSRYRVLSAHAVDEALPTLRTITPANLTALEKGFADRNDDYVEDFLTGDAKARSEAMFEHLEEHLERWIDNLNATQTALLKRFVETQPRLAELRLENRKKLQGQLLAVLGAVARGESGWESRLRSLTVDWEQHSTPEYRASLREWEHGMTQLLVDLDRALTAEQRSQVVARLREYSSILHELAGVGAATTQASSVTSAVP